jgi:hypothetical protein
MGFGGPVWHVSASAVNEPTAWAMAERALQGVGQAALGEWREHGQRAVHIRRRLSDEERERAGGLGTRDIRGTAEEEQRFHALLADAPHLRPYVDDARSRS